MLTLQEFYTKNKYDRWELNEPVFQDLINKIAAAMRWQVLDKEINGWGGIANGDYSLSIKIDTCPNKSQLSNPRIEIRCNWNCTVNGVNHNLWREIKKDICDNYTTNISCSVNRGADAIAKDIQKRLLPDYYKLWNIGMEELEKSLSHERRKTEKANHIFKIIDERYHPSWGDRNVMNVDPKIKPEIIQELGIYSKSTISVHAEVYVPYSIKKGNDYNVYNSEGVDGDVKFKLTVPYELSAELMEWIKSKTVNGYCFDTWKEYQIKKFIKWLDIEAEKAGLPEVIELPVNTFNWEDAYNKYWEQVEIEGYYSDRAVFQRFKESIVHNDDILTNNSKSVNINNVNDKLIRSDMDTIDEINLSPLAQAAFDQIEKMHLDSSELLALIAAIALAAHEKEEEADQATDDDTEYEDQE